jgi:hypothetical protein
MDADPTQESPIDAENQRSPHNATPASPRGRSQGHSPRDSRPKSEPDANSKENEAANKVCSCWKVAAQYSSVY